MSSGSLLTELAETQLRRACADLDRRLREGEQCRCEEYFDLNPALAADADQALELVYTEYATRADLGRPPTADEFAARFPQWGERLIRLLHVHEALNEGGAEGDLPIASAANTPAGLDAGTWPPSGLPALRPEQPRRAGPYELLDEIGRGGMGVVYKARQLGLDRVVALKVILSPHRGERDRARFRTEAEAAARLQHPHIVQIYDVGEQDGCPYLAMEFVDGTSLDRRLAQAPLPARAAAELIETLARAMHYAHGRGVVHRDLKPANVLLQRSEVRDQKSERNGGIREPSELCPLISDLFPKITDFGLAKQLSQPDRSCPDALTRSGAVIGTPSYMAPEQAGGKHVAIGPPADVYALGAILYEMLTGVPPFQGATALDTLEQVRSQEPIAPSRLHAKLPRDLETICLKCLEKQPTKRYVTAEELADDLNRFLAGEPIRARPIRFWTRATKWAKRRPAAAALVGTIAAIIAVGFPTTTGLWVRAEHSRAAAEVERNKADAARLAEQAERERVETLLYFHDVNLAHHEYLSHNLSRATQLLEGCRPDLRHWEWHYLDRLCHSALASLPHKLPVRGIAWSPDGKLLATCTGHWGTGQQGEVNIWDANSMKELFKLTGHPSSVTGVAFSPDGSRLASVGMVPDKPAYGGAIIWNVETGDEVLSIPRGDGLSVAFSPDGKLLAIGRRDGHVWLCDSLTGDLVHDLTGHPTGTFGVAFSPDGKTVASSGHDGTARIWNVAAGDLLLTVEIPGSARSVAYSPDGRFLTVGSYGGVIKVWDLATNREVATRETRAGGGKIAYSPDGRQIAVTTQEAGVRIWDAATGTERRSFHGHLGAPICVAFSPDGRRLASGGGWDTAAMVWDMTADLVPRQFTGHTSYIADMAIRPDGQRLALAGTARTSSPGRETPKTTRVWDLAQRRMIRELIGHSDWLTSVAYSPDGLRLVTGSRDRTAKIWNADTGQMLFSLEGHSDTVTSVSFSPDNNAVALASADRTVSVWNANAGEKTRTLEGHEDRLNSVAYGPSGRYLASAGADKTVRIWDATGKAIRVLRGHTGPVTVVAFSRDGFHLASGGDDSLVNIWDVSDLPGERESPAPRLVLRGHTDTILSLNFSPDGKRLASSAWDAATKVWDVATGQETITFRKTASNSSPVLFSPDSKRIINARGTEVSIWESERASQLIEAADGDAAQQHAIAWHESELKTCTRVGNWFAAAFHLGRLIAAKPDHRPYFVQRGRAYFELEQWAKAAADYEQATQLDRGNDNLWHRSAYLHLRAGNDAGYRALCPRFVAAFDPGKDCRIANALAWTCVLGPDAGVAPDEIVRLAERGVAGARAEQPDKVPSYLNTLGAALFRAGRYDEAIQRLNDAIDAHGDDGTPSDWLFLAMAHHRQGHITDAREWLDVAVEWIEQQAFQKATGGDLDPHFTPDRQIVLQVLRREAESMLGSTQ